MKPFDDPGLVGDRRSGEFLRICDSYHWAVQLLQWHICQRARSAFCPPQALPCTHCCRVSTVNCNYIQFCHLSSFCHFAWAKNTKQGLCYQTSTSNGTMFCMTIMIDQAHPRHWWHCPHHSSVNLGNKPSLQLDGRVLVKHRKNHWCY